jgi:hypothetical protein
MGLLSGAVCLLWSGYLGARYIGTRTGGTTFIFILIYSISVYYGMLFAFDSGRFAYPLGNLLAIGGLFLIGEKRYLPGIAVLAVSPGMYHPSMEVAGCVLIAATIYRLVDAPLCATMRWFATQLILVVVAMGTYLALTHFISYATGVPLGDRTRIDITASLQSYDRILRLIHEHALPFRTGIDYPYFSALVRYPIGIATMCYALVLLWLTISTRRFANGIGIALLTLLLFCGPFAFAFVSPLDEFTPRSLIGFTVVHAVMFTFCVDHLHHIIRAEALQRFSQTGLAMMAAVLVMASAMESSKIGIDEHIASQEDLYAVNRIIYRIDTVLARHELTQLDPIPIAVRYSSPTKAGARGHSGTSRYAPWAKEWIFRMVDQRFIPAPDPLKDQLLEQASNKPQWPAEGAVYVQDDVVVVVIN